MKRYLSIFLIILFLFFFQLKGYSFSCAYEMYYYNENAILLKFECDKIQPFILRLYTDSGDFIKEISYTPLEYEKNFLIICDEYNSNLVINVLYPGNHTTFLYTKN